MHIWNSSGYVSSESVCLCMCMCVCMYVRVRACIKCLQNKQMFSAQVT